MAQKMIKDLNQYLTAKTGLNAEEREQWRQKIVSLHRDGKKEEAMKVYQSISYWKTKYGKA